MIELLGLSDVPEIAPGDSLPDILAAALNRDAGQARANDVLVVTSKIVAKAENRFVDLESVVVSDLAAQLAELTRKDSRLVELILRESDAIIRAAPNVLITRHRLGLVMANAGIDASNIGPGRPGRVLLLPTDPDASARALSSELANRGWPVAIVLSDSFGRPWRLGVVNVAIGASGVLSLVDRRGESDRDGRTLQVTEVALADMIASAAGLVSGEGCEGIPAVLVRNCPLPAGDQGAAALIRSPDMDLFT